MQYTVNKGEKGKIEVKVDIPKLTFDETYQNVLGEHGKTVNIAGFRPGMAPVDIVEKHVGVSKVLNDSASFLINKHLSEIFEKEKFFPIDSPKIAVETLAQGSPFAFTASFIQKPTVTVGDWRKIKIKRVAAKEITEADIAESIKNIYEAWKKQKESAKPGEEAKADTDEEAGKYIYDAQGNKIFVGDEEGAKNKKIEAHKIDDVFARAIGAKDLSHLKELVKADLEKVVADQVEAKVEQEIFDKIVEISSVEIPDLLIEDELNRILVRLSNQLEQRGSGLDEYLKEQKTTIDEMKTKWREQAEKNVKTTLIMDEIGKDEKVQVAKEEVELAMKGVTEQNLTPDQRADLERYIVLSIFQAKTLEIVKKAVTAS